MILERFAYSPFGTFGRLTGKGLDVFTVERPWDANKPFVSCIPEGIYTCKRVQSPKFGNTFEVTRVPHRSHILFHVANTADDLQGCIGLGEQLGALGGKWAILSSRNALSRFFATLAGIDEFTLSIQPYRPEYP